MDASVESRNSAAAPDLNGLLNGRFSCRAFRREALPREQLQRVLTLAQRTPSWCNTQPWQVAVVSGRSLQTLADELVGLARVQTPKRPDFPFPETYLGEYRERRKVCGVQLYQALGIGRDDRDRAQEQSLENFRFFGAPHALFVSTDAALGFYGGLDCGLYAMSVVLAAQAEGLGTCVQAALATYPDVIRAHVGWPDDRRVLFGIAIGMPDPDHPIHGYRTERADPSDVVRWVD
ncbi:MAG: nitroreductase [Burkholderiales bacterium]|nr:nitroreductase [Burkholderiales bacterium]